MFSTTTASRCCSYDDGGDGRGGCSFSASNESDV